MRARAQRRAMRLLRVVPGPVRRRAVRWAAPSFAVGALCLVQRADGAALLVRATYRPGWGLPGGLLRRGEAPEAGAAREVAEEVGLAVVPVGPPTTLVHPRRRQVDLAFRVAPLPDAELARARPTSPEIDQVGWFPLDDLPPLQPETVAALGALASVDPSQGA